MIYRATRRLANYEKRLSEAQLDTMLEGLFYYGLSSKKVLPFALEKKKTPKDWVKLMQQYQDDSEYPNAITKAIKETKQNDLALLLSRSEEHTSELQSRFDLVCRLLLEK